MSDRIDFNELTESDREVAMFLFNAMGDVYFNTPDRRRDVDGKAEITLTINGVECPVIDTIKILLAEHEEGVRRAAQIAIGNRLADVSDGISEVEQALERIRFVSGVIDCFILTDGRSKVERVIDGWEHQAARDHVEKDEKKRRKRWYLYHQFTIRGEVKVELVETWHPGCKRWERVREGG